VSQKQ
jgi:hypothetical protein